MHRYVISGLDQNLLTNCLRVTQEEQPNGSITYFVNHCAALLQSSISILDGFCKPLVAALEPDINYFRQRFSHWTKTGKLGTLNNLPITHWVKCQQNMWRHFLLIIAAKKCQGFFRHSRGRDYDPPRLSSRLRKKEGEIASDDDDDAWVVAHGAEGGHEGHQATKGWPTIKFCRTFFLIEIHLLA